MIRPWFASAVACMLIGTGLWLPRPAAAQFESLAAKIPSTANAIVLLDAQKIMASPIAQKEGWKEKYEEAFLHGV